VLDPLPEAHSEPRHAAVADGDTLL
jgi:hypothetical protein